MDIWFHVVSSRLWAIPLLSQFSWYSVVGNGIRPTYFNVVLLVVFPFISDTFLKLLVSYCLFAVCFFACGYVIVLGIFGF